MDQSMEEERLEPPLSTEILERLEPQLSTEPLEPEYSLFALGSNSHGQLGVGHYRDVNVPTKSSRCPYELGRPLREPRVASISSGGSHTMIRLRSGKVWMGGWGLRTTNGVRRVEPGHVRFLPANLAHELFQGTCRHVTSTWEASIFVMAHDTGDRLLVLGQGAKGELGLGEAVLSTHGVPVPLSNGLPSDIKGIVDISSGLYHTAMVLDNGEVWGWGHGRKGKLGTSVNSVTWRPTKVEGIEFAACRVVCGLNFTAVVGLQRQVVVLGDEKWNVKADAPQSLPEYEDIKATWNGVYVLLKDRRILAWGRDDKGQLPQKNLPPIKAIATGSEHVVALTQLGQVLGWGWGEHGNCGTELDENMNVYIGTYNVLHPAVSIYQEKAVAIGAGYATSFWETYTEKKPREIDRDLTYSIWREPGQPIH